MRQFILGTTYAFHLIYSAVLYLAIAFSLYRIAVNNHVKYAWLAFIPIGQYAIIGMICEEYILWGYRIRPLSLVLVGLGILETFFSFLFPIGIVINLFFALILHKFYYLFNPQRAWLYAVLSLLGQIPVAIILYLIKNQPMCMSAGAFPYPFANRR